MNRNDYLIELCESKRTDFGRVEFSDQSEEQKVFSAIWELESQVNNGGFLQFFENCSNEIALFASVALRRIGANRCTNIVERALHVLSIKSLPGEQVAREETIRALSPGRRAELEKLDDEFFKYPDNLTDLLWTFVKAHPKEFGASAE